jgi:SlyX protein
MERGRSDKRATHHGFRLADNGAMEHDDDTERRLTELEIKAAFTEDLLDELNRLVARQQEQIELLVRELVQLRQQQAAGGEGTPRSLRDELPPHY